MDKSNIVDGLKQYFKQFWLMYLVTGLVILITIGACIIFLVNILFNKVTGIDEVQLNVQADKERVFDYADVLTDSEEDILRNLIRENEVKNKLHIVLVTAREDMESGGRSWERSMRDYADDIYDQGNYGYEKVHGTGALLLDNWYDGQEGTWLSTCGNVEDCFGDYEIDQVVDVTYNNISSPFNAYYLSIKEISDVYQRVSRPMSIFTVFVISLFGFPVILIICGIYFRKSGAKDKDTTDAYTYIPRKSMTLKNKQDTFLRKSVRSVRINTSSGSHSGGGGGHHRSSGGVRHGGGGRRR